MCTVVNCLLLFPISLKMSFCIPQVPSKDEVEHDGNLGELWDSAVLRASKIFETRRCCIIFGNDGYSHVVIDLLIQKSYHLYIVSNLIHIKIA